MRVGETGAGPALDDLRRQLAALLVHEHAPPSLAQQASGVPGGSPLFTSILNYRHNRRPDAAEPARRDGDGLSGVRMVFTREPTNYPVAVLIEDTGTEFGLIVDAVPSVDGDAACRLLHTCLGNLVTALAEEPAERLAAVGVLPGTERQRLVQDWNDTAVPVPAQSIPNCSGPRSRAHPTQ